MNNSQSKLYFRWYHYLNNLDFKYFTMKSFTEGDISQLEKRRPFSNTKACPAGFLPVIFPQWSWFYDGIPLLKEKSTEMFSKDIELFFGLSEEQALNICVPKRYDKPTLNAVLTRMYKIAKTYGYKIELK